MSWRSGMAAAGTRSANPAAAWSIISEDRLTRSFNHLD
jgi:hypothetical protein